MSYRSFYPDLWVEASTWVIVSSEDDVIQTYRENAISGLRKIKCSHRSKLGGVISRLKHVKCLCSKLVINILKIKVGCNRVEGNWKS